MKSLKNLYWWWFKLPNDKKAHLGAGKDIAWVTLLIVMFAGMFTQLAYLFPAVLMSGIVGFGKELYDKYVKKSVFDKEDLKLTVYGGISVTIIQIVYIILVQTAKVFWL